MFTPFDRCPAGVFPSESFLCELGATANSSAGKSLTSAVLACPPASCLDFGCPGHEFYTKGLQGCLNVSAAIDTTFEVEFMVFDQAIPSSVFRTITITSPCTTIEAPYFCHEDRTCSSVECDIRDSLAAVVGSSLTSDKTPPVIYFATDNTTTDAATGVTTIVASGEGLLVVDYGVPVNKYFLSPSGPASATEGRSRFAGASDGRDGDVSNSLTAKQSRTDGTDAAVCSLQLVEQALCAPGQYAFRFTAKDNAGNTAGRTLTVRMVERAVTAFSITLQTAHATLAAAQAEGASMADPASSASLAVRTGVAAKISASLPAAGISLADVTIASVVPMRNNGAATYSLVVGMEIVVTTTNATSGRERPRGRRQLAQEGGSSAAQLAASVGAAVTSTSTGQINHFEGKFTDCFTFSTKMYSRFTSFYNLNLSRPTSAS
jgi:hypothetical protein